MFNIIWNSIIESSWVREWAKPFNLMWLELLVSQVKRLHTEFLAYRTEVIYRVRFNSQIIYLTKRLNDKWDNINKGIYINNVADVSRIYIYNKIEQREKYYLYNKYNALTNYSTGEFSSFGDSVYKATQPSTGKQPNVSPDYWIFHKKRVYLNNKTEYQGAIDFIVMVPVAVVFNNNEMKALINYYNLAGKRYTIQTY